MFWKLDALQMFVLDLHWPEPEFAKHLEQRLKLMASDMMEACVKRSEPKVTTGEGLLPQSVWWPSWNVSDLCANFLS